MCNAGPKLVKWVKGIGKVIPDEEFVTALAECLDRGGCSVDGGYYLKSHVSHVT